MVIMAVSNFVVLAGGSRMSGFLDKRTLPEMASMTTAARALMVWVNEAEGDKIFVSREKANTQKRTLPKHR